MAVLVTAIHVFPPEKQVVDGRNKSGHDGERDSSVYKRALDKMGLKGDTSGRR